MVDWIRSLGVTSVELLPIHTFINDSYLIEKGLTNYWGYNTIGFFAPDPRYSSKPAFAHAEFKEMVAHFHDAGLEVILDVVYNHTAEGNERGPSLSFRGIDNVSYYRLLPDQKRFYINDTGTGNTLNLSNSRVLQMVADSLRYWVQEMHVDGFRFDLGTILARETYGFDQSSGFLHVCQQDPVLNGVKLIAEPWDVGPGGYQVGGFPPGWAEWNDRFRDDVRAFWKGDEHKAPGARRRAWPPRPTCSTSAGASPGPSVNFITAHDGFTLRDTVSYNEKHNEANGEDNRDGNDNNHSWNFGVEGETDDEEINEARRRQMRNMLATLFLSQGTPMLLAGDEFGRTQGGNNNAYCQDNEISWLDWDIPEWGLKQADLVRRLTAAAAALPDPAPHPLLHRRRDARSRRRQGRDLGQRLGQRDAGQRLGRRPDEMLRHADRRPGAADRHPQARQRRDDADRGQRRITTWSGSPCRDCTNGKAWELVLDTNVPERDDAQTFAIGETYDVTQRSLLLFALQSRLA